MKKLEKILEEIKESSIIVATSKEHYIHPQDGRFVEEVVLLDCIEDIICKHMNDGWILVDERMATQEECEDNWFWIAYGDSFGNSPRVARCEWVFADDENGNDASGSEFYIDQFPLPYKPSKNLIKAWKIIDIPAPYRPERNGT